MLVGVIDVGPSTVRLLVARLSDGAVMRVHEERARVGLSAEVERLGRISGEMLFHLGAAAWAQAERARDLGCHRLEVVLTSPGRQTANPRELQVALERATGAPVRLLNGEDEGLLAYWGALSALRRPPRSVTVCDVGGGSTQLVFGTPSGPAWARSVDVGALRLTLRLLDGDPPDSTAAKRARVEVERCFDGVMPPRAKGAIAVGGSARAIARVVGGELGTDELRRATDLLLRRTRRDLARRFRIAPGRAETLLAGALILGEVQRRLGLPLHVSAAGVREGAAAELLRERLAA